MRSGLVICSGNRPYTLLWAQARYGIANFSTGSPALRVTALTDCDLMRGAVINRRRPPTSSKSSLELTNRLFQEGRTTPHRLKMTTGLPTCKMAILFARRTTLKQVAGLRIEWAIGPE
jgi:hypothetical protein